MHINAAQKILSKQFPSFSGFDSTLKQQCIGKWVRNYIQFFSVVVVIGLLQAQWDLRKEL